MSQFGRDKPLPDEGWSKTPHGLWTLPVSTGARILLGWLHSHTGEFMKGVTTNQARRALKTSSIPKWLNELAEIDMIVVVKSTPGKADSYVLKTDPWMALMGARDRAETGSVASTTKPKPARYRAETGAPKSARTEEQVQKNISEDHSSHACGDGLTINQRARAIAVGLYDWTKEQTGHKPVAWKVPQMIKLIAPFLEERSDIDVKRALVALHRSGTTYTRPTIERQLNGISPSRRSKGPDTDTLQNVYETLLQEEQESA